MRNRFLFISYTNPGVNYSDCGFRSAIFRHNGRFSSTSDWNRVNQKVFSKILRTPLFVHASRDLDRISSQVRSTSLHEIHIFLGKNMTLRSRSSFCVWPLGMISFRYYILEVYDFDLWRTMAMFRKCKSNCAEVGGNLMRPFSLLLNMLEVGTL